MKTSLLLVVALLPLAKAGASSQFTEIVAFGDSLTDSGNRAVATSAATAKYPKQVWITQLAGPDFLNIADFRPSGKGAFKGGTNYAYGGATTACVAKMKVGDSTGHNLTRQISGEYLNPSYNTAGVKPDALHVLRIGGNDLMFTVVLPEQIASQWSGMDDIAREAARDTESQVEALGKAGVRNVLWLNLSDPSAMPAVRTLARTAGPLTPVLLKALTKSALAYNAEMDAAIERLKTACPDMRVVKLDLDAFFQELAANPAKFGFKTVKSGANDDDHFFSADQLHPTPHGHRVLAEVAFKALPAFSESATIQSAKK